MLNFFHMRDFLVNKNISNLNVLPEYVISVYRFGLISHEQLNNIFIKRIPINVIHSTEGSTNFSIHIYPIVYKILHLKYLKTEF